MPTTTYIVSEVPGAKRTSKRPYTHAVIGRRDPRLSAVAYAEDLRKNEGRNRKWDAESWDGWNRTAAATVGQLYRNHNGYMVEAREAVVEIGREFIAANPDRAAYIEGQAAGRAAHLEQLKAGEPGPLYVLQWSMSLANATKAVGSKQTHHSDVRVVPCMPAQKAAA